MPDGTLKVKIRKPPQIGERGYVRIAGEAYFTRPWLTEAGLSRIALRGVVWECACGAGHMTRVLAAHGHTVVSTDIAEHGFDGQSATLDFLATQAPPDPRIGTIFTNPPNCLADAFAWHAIQLMKPVGGMVVMLFDHAYVAAGPTRDALFERPMPWSAWIVVTRRPKWFDDPAALTPEERRKKGPRRNYAFCVWDWQHEGPPVIARVR